MGLLALTVAFTSCTPKQTQVLLQPSESLGTVLAQETALLAGANKRVAIISPDASWGETSTAEAVFRNVLRKQGFEVVTAKSVRLGDPMRRGQIGLTVEDFFEALEKSTEAGVIVSFAGAPLMKSADAAVPSTKHPPVLVIATASLGNVPGLWSDPIQLAHLIEAGIIQLAFIDTSEPPPQTGKGDGTRDLFARHYRILRQTN
jgi:hypothetical protein